MSKVYEKTHLNVYSTYPFQNKTDVKYVVRFDVVWNGDVEGECELDDTLGEKTENKFQVKTGEIHSVKRQKKKLSS